VRNTEDRRRFKSSFVVSLAAAGVGAVIGARLVGRGGGGGAIFSSRVLVWARRRLGRNWSGEVTVKVDHELVRVGPYRRIRHPIYTAAIGMYLGPALVSGRLQGLLSLALVAIAYARKIRQQERVLRAESGAAYQQYRRESHALVPWIL
jgi:protein-S-isoprenylcysteine O-methyltransferase Ste14